MYKAPSKLIPKVTNNSKLGVTSNSLQSPSKLIPKLPPNSNFVTKNLPSGAFGSLGVVDSWQREIVNNPSRRITTQAFIMKVGMILLLCKWFIGRKPCLYIA
jgi:hypothetical protein